MIGYKKNDARAWARDNMKGVSNVIIPSYTNDLRRINEKGVRHDVRKNIEYGFWGTLLVSEVAITIDEYVQFVEWAHDEAGSRQKLVFQAGFNTLEENIEAALRSEKAGTELALLGYPQTFYATTNQDIYDYTKAFCDATNMGVILFPVPTWGFERIHPAGMSPELVAQMVKDIPNIVCIKSEAGMPQPAGFVQTWKRHGHEVVVTFPIEGEALLLASLVPMQFMGTNNSGYYGNMTPKMFRMAQEGHFEEMMTLYWQMHPARTAYATVRNNYRGGSGMIHRMEWKYQCWLSGYNGGPMRSPTMKILDRNMRVLRDGLVKSKLPVTGDPDSEFFIGRNPA